MPKDTQRTTTSDQALDHLPEQVTVAVAELASAAREGLLALAVGTGLQVLEAMLAEDLARLVGPKGRHLPERAAASPSRSRRVDIATKGPVTAPSSRPKSRRQAHEDACNQAGRSRSPRRANIPRVDRYEDEANARSAE